MGRFKLELKRIENTTKRQITFSKRKKGLIKKAYELSTLCDIDLALIMFSPSDRLCLFSGQTRIEEVLARYINLHEQERENAIVNPGCRNRQGIQNKEDSLRILEKIKFEDDMALQINEPRVSLTFYFMNVKSSEAIQINEELEQEICRLQQQLHILEEELRKFEPDPTRFTSMEEIEACETHLLNTLTCVVHRTEHLLNKSSTQQSIIPNDIVVGWKPEAGPKQAHIIDNSAYQSNQLSYDVLLQGSHSSANQNQK